MALRILLADDHQIVRQGLRALLVQAGFEVVGEASDGLEAIRLARDLHPDVVVLDVTMPILNGLAAAGEIVRECAQGKTILLTMHTEEPYVLQALRSGVRGYVVKSQMADDLLEAIREVARGKVYLSPVVAEVVVQEFLGNGVLTPDALSAREVQVLQLLAEGKGIKDTAELLEINYKTVESHRHRIMSKLDIHDVPGLVRYAIRRGLTRP